MNSKVFRSATQVSNKKGPPRSTQYRHRKFLRLRLQQIGFASWLRSEADEELLEILCDEQALIASDIPRHIQNTFIKWRRRLPQDRKFYQMVKQQLMLFRKFAHLSLEEFLQTAEGQGWLQARKRLKRKPYFEWDRPFKKTKRSAETNARVIRNLLRTHPALRMEDLKKLGLKNVQATYEGFRFRSHYHQKFLTALKQRLPSFE